MLPARGSDTERVFEELDLAFTILFTLELAFNMAGNMWIKFWRDSWNWFDFLVVRCPLAHSCPPSSVFAPPSDLGIPMEEEGCSEQDRSTVEPRKR
mmetsp:Transcript_35573/g.71264  ORF Transcript_35573/g.71264 Transcript_35573/m.71264 type:complete len:96 (+) Transcript_35573:474-761(+)